MQISLRPVLIASTAVALGLALTACSSVKSSEHAAAKSVLTADRLDSSTTASGPAVLVSKSVADNTFELERRSTGTRFTASLNGGTPVRNDAEHNWENVDDSVVVRAGSVVVLDRGSFPDQQIGIFAGHAGRDVIAVEVHPEHGVDARAELTGGYFIAAWHGGELGSHSDARIVLRLSDGTSRTMSVAELG